ncbi:unnamed protein product [Lasius platythorax]|uniref:Uncharacterized protein n=1 Tax=Lasius platythorax TaxID=488582 RepID=A0AAV2P7K9_9HYME
MNPAYIDCPVEFSQASFSRGINVALQPPPPPPPLLLLLLLHHPRNGSVRQRRQPKPEYRTKRNSSHAFCSELNYAWVAASKMPRDRKRNRILHILVTAQLTDRSWRVDDGRRINGLHTLY